MNKPTTIIDVVLRKHMDYFMESDRMLTVYGAEKKALNVIRNMDNVTLLSAISSAAHELYSHVGKGPLPN
ncbi:hypothetical protein PL78_06395 [Yersinia entomophaga]|uniref:Uncharacterized protein n=1 Tax=Yersinia entomophaga TaxID=935293 RepID=A0ABM6BIZ8_YERET|nr:hypothetical protein [Yersinia entomophaga]ANI29468.1 hypothetical protein PL78_06395 [Yersinia entomophaga]OWF86885.1 hypothetical protein B4914_13480 [Yersinia entomophaga]